LIPEQGRSGFKRADFENLQILGQGESGQVFLAIHRPTQRQFAVKEISITATETRHQMCKELQALHECGRTDHIVNLIDFFAEEGRVYLVLEYMDWGSIDRLLKILKDNGSRMEEPVLSVIMGCVLHALNFLHGTHKLIHRDLKPGNVVLNKQGVAKLTDLGVSRVLNMEGKGITFVGTAAYMSPERLEGRHYTSKADIWSVGVIAVECALGKHPYLTGQESSFFDLMQRVVVDPPAVPDGSGLSEELVSFIRCCLMKDEQSRSSAHDLLQHPFILRYSHLGFEPLRQCLSGLPSTV